jgi:single-strand DNA-binding protein
MSNETYVTIIGQVSKDPEMKHTQSGAGVARVTVVTNARKFNKQTNEWEKKPGKFWDAEAWNQGKALLADNIYNTVKKGDTVILYGELETREYTTKEGEQRKVDQIRIEGIGKDLRWHQAYANDVPNQPQQQPPAAQQQTWGGNQPAQADPWGQPSNEPAF